MSRSSNFIILGVALLLATAAPGLAWAECEASFINPVADVCWSCVFPVKIGGFTVKPSNLPDTQDKLTGPVCACRGSQGIKVPGITVSFWEPNRIIETVMDPMCFPSLGFDMPNPIGGPSALKGSVRAGGGGKDSASLYAAQAHLIIFPVWQLMDLLVDMPCVDHDGMDIAYFTELDPLWQSDFMSLILNPEALVFANPALQFACMADAVAAATDLPRNELFWCMGQWGAAYPLTGKSPAENMMVGGISLASKLIYKLNREFLMCDWNAGDTCGCVRTPIWKKQNYRLQIARPKRNTGTAVVIGEPSALWSSNQKKMGKGDENMAFVIFRKVSCCVTY